MLLLFYARVVNFANTKKLMVVSLSYTLFYYKAEEQYDAKVTFSFQCSLLHTVPQLLFINLMSKCLEVHIPLRYLCVFST